MRALSACHSHGLSWDWLKKLVVGVWAFAYGLSMHSTGQERVWLESLRPGVVRELFEFLPNMLYFAKDLELRLMAGNRAFVQRCGFSHEAELIGRTDHDIFPIEMAEKFGQDDRRVIDSGEALSNIIELFPNQLNEPEWFVTHKVPLFDRAGNVAGLCGMVQSYEGARKELQPYLDLIPVTDYLKKNFAMKTSVANLAKQAGMSERQLERRFKDAFKTTPQQYIIKLRVLEACELLANSSLPMTEIALNVGFYDQSSFSKKFTAMMGTTPLAYRKRFATKS